jgi:hypothetical protein
MVAMPWHYLNCQPWALEIKTKEAELRVLEHEFALVLSRLEGLEVSDTTKAIVQGYINGALTIKELNAAIDQHLNLKS